MEETISFRACPKHCSELLHIGGYRSHAILQLSAKSFPESLVSSVEPWWRATKRPRRTQLSSYFHEEAAASRIQMRKNSFAFRAAFATGVQARSDDHEKICLSVSCGNRTIFDSARSHSHHDSHHAKVEPHQFHAGVRGAGGAMAGKRRNHEKSCDRYPRGKSRSEKEFLAEAAVYADCAREVGAPGASGLYSAERNRSAWNYSLPEKAACRTYAVAEGSIVGGRDAAKNK